MKLFKVTFRFKKLPWYTITGIEAPDRHSALKRAYIQMEYEVGEGHPMKLPITEEQDQ